mgnify:CR=1 FL=1
MSTIGSSKQLQLVSDTNHFVSFLLQFRFQILPIVSVLGILSWLLSTPTTSKTEIQTFFV